MSADANELLLLGLLARESMHGYRLHEFLEQRLAFVSDLKKPTAYRLLDQLHQRGLISRAAERSGRRPERYVYQLTAAGHARFEALLHDQLRAAHGVADTSSVALLFIHHLPPAEQQALLSQRRAAVAAQRETVAAQAGLHTPGTGPRLVLDRALAHLSTELAWLDAAIGALGVAHTGG